MTITQLIEELNLLLEGRPLLAVCDEAPRKWVLL